MSTDIQPFRIAATDAQLADLKRRLRETRWPERECVDDWTQGLPLAYAQEVASYWFEKYDWRAREARLNRFPQFKTAIDGRRNPLYPCPLAACGCDRHWCDAWMAGLDRRVSESNRTADQPDRARRRGCRRVPPRVPSLPGYGFSNKPTRTGWNVQRIANAWSELMLRLGYKRYAAQGGDWGAAITTCIGFQDPANCLGIHVNMPHRAALAGANRSFEHDHRDGKIGVRWLPVLQRLGLWVLQGTEYAAANRWLRP